MPLLFNTNELGAIQVQIGYWLLEVEKLLLHLLGLGLIDVLQYGVLDCHCHSSHIEICEIGLPRLQQRSNSGREGGGRLGIEFEQHLNTVEDRVRDIDIIL